MRILKQAEKSDLGIVPISDATVAVLLVENTAIEIPVPTNANVAHFSCDIELFIIEGEAATLPTTDPTEGKLERNPVLRSLQDPVETIGVISPNAGYLVVSFYA